MYTLQLGVLPFKLILLPPPYCFLNLFLLVSSKLSPNWEASAPSCSQKPLSTASPGAQISDPAAVPFVPQPCGAHSRVHTGALTLPRPRSRHPTLRHCSSVGREGGQVTSGLQSREERLEKAVRSSSPAEDAGGALGQPGLPRTSLSSAPAVTMRAREGASPTSR